MPVGRPVARERIAWWACSLDSLEEVGAILEESEVEPRLVVHPEPRKPSLRHRLEAVHRVGDPVHARDLVAVEGGDRNLHDRTPGRDELDQDLGVEVEVVRIELKRDRAECLDLVGAIAGVELGEVAAEHPVLDRGQHLVADPLVNRHAAAQRLPALDHPRRDQRVRLPQLSWRHDLRQILGRVLPVPVKEDDVVVALLDRVQIAELLVAAVAPVERRAQHGHVVEAQPLSGRARGLEGEIARRVVDHEDLGEEVAKLQRDPLEDALDEVLRLEGDDEDRDPCARRLTDSARDRRGNDETLRRQLR